MPQTRWLQDFFSSVPPIAMIDPLASTLGAVGEGEPIYYSYADCVKLAGHACASVSSAFQMTKIALQELYGKQLPVRGEIRVRFAGGREDGANGPIGQVIQFLTGAAIETGFHGLGGRFARAGMFQYDERLEEKAGNRLMAVFTRTDTRRSVAVFGDPSVIPMSESDRFGAVFFPKVVTGTATPEERDKFFAFWQGKNKKILLEEHGAFSAEHLD